MPTGVKIGVFCLWESEIYPLNITCNHGKIKIIPITAIIVKAVDKNSLAFIRKIS
jgi:hypothetical protein